MSEFTIIEENPISLVQIEQELKKLKKEGELSFRAEKTKTYLENFCQTSPKDLKKISEEIRKINIPRFKERHIAKIVDLMPGDLDSLKVILSGEVLTLSEEDMKKILNVIPQ